MPEESSLPGTPLAHVVNRLQASEFVCDPYPHYYLENVLPSDYYHDLLSHLPDSAVYQNLFDVTTLKLDHFRYRDQRDLNDGWTDRLPDELRTFWVEFNRWFLGPELARAVLHTFGEPLRERFGEEAAWPAVSIEAQLIRHRAGYFLGPHSDLYSKIVVVLLYLAPDDKAEHLGTSIYRPRLEGFTSDDSAHYPFADFVRVKTASYKRNSLLAFLRSGSSFHGVEPLAEEDIAGGNRDLIQYVLYDKQAREAQLRTRRLAAMEGVPE
jgi:hypothetical protein